MGRPLASAPEPTDAEGQPLSRLRCIPEDPATPLLTVAGAPLLEGGKLDLSAYEALIRYFAREPLAEAHPNPNCPGVRGDEVVPKGLRMWDDVKALREGQTGAGWIASYRPAERAGGAGGKDLRRRRRDCGTGGKERWFNIQTCGSWRLSFLLAQLQLRVWQQGCHSATTPQPEESKPLQAVSATRITKKRKVEASEILTKEPAADLEKELAAELEAMVEEPLKPRAPRPLTETSARMQQLLERVRAREAGKDAPSPVKPAIEAVESKEEASCKVSLLIAAAGEHSPPPKQRELREPDSGEKLAKQPRLD